MAFNRALVVDDSRTARQSLAKLLAQYDLEVAFAETGEEALAFLQHELVDVIFMDHSMPGMDGLEAVSAIKSNPRTATIPVMMYTTREGEVYVSQARALGAVGVLPKEVQPGVLFDMLNKLGLVGERRSGESVPPADVPRRRISDLVDDVDREYEQRAVSISVQTLVTRILNEQHLKLRGDILSSHRRFAREVAAEILEQRGVEAPAAAVDRRRPLRVLGAAAAALAVGLVVLAGFTWQVMDGRDAALLEVARLTSTTRTELDALHRRNDGITASIQSQQDETLARLRTAMEALEWSLNQSGIVAFDEAPFGDAAAERLDGLLGRLAAVGFRGRVLLTAELAPFCLTRDASGFLVLADPVLPLDACDLLGHPLQDERSVAALQSVGFAAAMDAWQGHGGITVELASRQPFGGDTLLPFSADDAGDWNRLASRSNRVYVTLMPEGADGAIAASH
jgi:CheY-like chemotaxis protein